MNEKAVIKLTEALWSIQIMLSDLNKGDFPDAEQVDTLEEEISDLEELLGI